MKRNYERERHKQDHQGLDPSDGQALRDSEIAIIGYGDNGHKQEAEEQAYGNHEQEQEPEIFARDEEDIAEKIGGQIGHKAGREIGEQDAQTHTERPKHGDGRVLAHIAPTEKINAITGKYGKKCSTQQRREAQISTQTHAAERSVGHAATNDHHAARDDVSADHRAKDADEQAAKEGVSEKLVC